MLVLCDAVGFVVSEHGNDVNEGGSAVFTYVSIEHVLSFHFV